MAREFAVTLAWRVADWWSTPLAAELNARRGAAVVKVWSAPAVVPEALVATTRKWYVLWAVRPAIGALTAWGVLPLPAELVAVEDPYAAVGPYWKE